MKIRSAARFNFCEVLKRISAPRTLFVYSPWGVHQIDHPLPPQPSSVGDTLISDFVVDIRASHMTFGTPREYLKMYLVSIPKNPPRNLDSRSLPSGYSNVNPNPSQTSELSTTFLFQMPEV
jgi:hypothetical protein